MSKKAISLQKQLIKNALLSSIIAGVIGYVCLIGLSTYQTMTLHDEFMGEISEYLLGNVNQAKGNQIDELSKEFDIHYVLYLNNKILTTSNEEHFIHQKKPEQQGYRFEYQSGEIYRIFTAQNDGLQVEIVQPLDKRFDEIWQSILSFGLILLVLWLIQFIILYFVVKWQLKPLHKISREIAEKSAQDLTPIQNTQPKIEELQPIIYQLNRMLSRVDQALSAEQRFTADASHELRSPLSAIHLRLQVLKRKYRAYEDLMVDLQPIQTDIVRGTQVLENLLLLARLDPTSSIENEIEKINLKIVIQEVLKTFEQMIEQKNLNIQLNIEELWVFVHPSLMQIALRNLVENALKYTPEHGEIFIQTKMDQQNYMIKIENSGNGISTESMQRLGERFYRVLGTQTQGSGLGLSIAEKIIVLHQGHLRLEPSTRGGLKVMIELKYDSN